MEVSGFNSSFLGPFGEVGNQVHPTQHRPRKVRNQCEHKADTGKYAGPFPSESSFREKRWRHLLVEKPAIGSLRWSRRCAQ